MSKRQTSMTTKDKKPVAKMVTNKRLFLFLLAGDSSSTTGETAFPSSIKDVEELDTEEYMRSAEREDGILSSPTATMPGVGNGILTLTLGLPSLSFFKFSFLTTEKEIKQSSAF